MRRLFRLFGRTGIVTAIVKDSTGSTYNYGDFTNTNAFLWSDLNLSPYAGTDLGSTPYYIEVLDAAGKKAIGYIGAIGLGETLSPTELVTNGDFASAEPPGTAWRRDAGWTISGGVLVAASGQVSLRFTNSHLVLTENYSREL